MCAESIAVKSLSEKYCIHEDVVNHFVAVWGLTTTEKILKASLTPPPTCIRCNTLKTTPDILYSRLTKAGFILKRLRDCEYGFHVTNPPFPLSHTIEYLNGEFFIQTQASLYPPIVLSPQVNEQVLDLTAAPGGKTTHIAQLMEDKGLVVAIESHRGRLPSLIFNIRRLGIINTTVLHLDARLLDTKQIRFDRILLDAPCSGTGLLAVDPEVKKTSRTASIKHHSQIQSQLLDVAVRLLSPSGTLVYSTCTFAPEENEQQIDLLLRKYAYLRLCSTGLTIGAPGLSQAFHRSFHEDMRFTRRLYPHTDNTIGFFIAKIQTKS